MEPRFGARGGPKHSRSWVSGPRHRWTVRALAACGLAFGTAAFGLAPTASAQLAGLGLAITPGFQNPVTVGQQDQSALVQLVNDSFGLLAAIESVNVTNIRMNPGCAVSSVIGGAATPSPCGTPEPRADSSQPILDLDQSSVAGTTCTGGPFMISGPDAQGDYAFTPTGGPVTLAPVGQPGSSCRIRFTFDVVQAPSDGATFQVTALLATSLTFPGGVPQTGVSLTAVNAAPTTTTTIGRTTTTTAAAGVSSATTVPPGVAPVLGAPPTLARTGARELLVPGAALLALGLLGLTLVAVAHRRRTWFAG